MKQRTGFVSNSSSSSFIIASKGPLVPHRILEAFRVPEDSPLHAHAKDLAACLVNLAEETTLEKLVDEYGDLDSVPELAKQAYKRDMKIYQGSASDQEYGDEATLCGIDINHQSDDLIIEKEGMY